ncbi:MAG: agmatinase [Alphaproteobacteria bacterium]|nr:MAG: agmatinase [Alphaproteobacteria bacterium]
MSNTEIKPEDSRETAYAGILSFLRFPYSRDLDKADIAVLGVPYDLGTTNRSGARSGPRAIREQSSLVGEYEWGVWPWDYHLSDRHHLVDYGDICDFTAYPERMTAELERMAGEIISRDTALLSLGGDHFISLPLLRAHVKKHGPLALVHFDAHTDTWVDDSYNHGTMFYHAIQEGLIDVDHSIQVGIRTPNPDTFGLQIIDAIMMNNMSNSDIAGAIHDRVGDRKAYLSFDIDFLDPAYAPGTGTPVSGGATIMQGREILRGLRGLTIVGGDLVEVAPAYDPIGSVTALAAATLACDILYLISETLTRD